MKLIKCLLFTSGLILTQTIDQFRSNEIRNNYLRVMITNETIFRHLKNINNIKKRSTVYSKEKANTFCNKYLSMQYKLVFDYYSLSDDEKTILDTMFEMVL